jgi:hypothetical protein
MYYIETIDTTQMCNVGIIQTLLSEISKGTIGVVHDPSCHPAGKGDSPLDEALEELYSVLITNRYETL